MGYDAWGQVRVRGDLKTDIGYTGQRQESVGLGGLYDYGARFYSPALGRFLSADTIVPEPGNPESLNRFSYTRNNPLKYIDPSGHRECYGYAPSSQNDMGNGVGADSCAGGDWDAVHAEENLGKLQDQIKTEWNQQMDWVDLGWDWFLNRGSSERHFGSDTFLTQDLMNHEGVEQARAEYVKAGFPSKFDWDFRIDATGGGGIVGGAVAYIRENMKLLAWGLGKRDIPAQAVGGVLGSYHVHITRKKDGNLEFQVSNQTGWASGTRIPGTGSSVLQNHNRLGYGPGATVTEFFYWTEPLKPLQTEWAPKSSFH